MSDQLTLRLEELTVRLDELEREMVDLIESKDIINDSSAETEFNAISNSIYLVAGEIESIVSAIN